jgi:hypothetical protein
MNIFEKIDKQKVLLAGLLVAAGVILRIVLHDFFNGIANPWAEYGFLDVFFVTALVAIVSGILLGKYFTIIVPLFVLVITDVFYAFADPSANLALFTSWLFLFTLSGYVIMALMGFYTKKKSKLNISFIPKILVVGIIAVIIYDIWTNFGFWLSYSKMGWYPPTLEGLGTVFAGGLPFMLWHILSTAIALTIVVVPMVYLKEHKILKSEIVLKPFEKYSITGATAILMILSIITAVI